MSADIDQACRSAYDLISAGRAADAVMLMSPIVDAAPENANAQRMLGLALAAAGDPAAGEARLRFVLTLLDAPQIHVDLANVLFTQGKTAAAAESMRHAFIRARRLAPFAVEMAQRLIAAGRPADALILTIAMGDHALTLHAEALRQMHRLDEAITAFQRAAAADTRHTPALTETLLEAERYEEAAAVVQRLIDQGVRAPQAYRVLAKAQQGLGRFDDAETNYRAALALNDAYAPAHRDLAELLWMRTGDAETAAAPVTEAIARHPTDANLRIVKAKLLEFIGDPRAGLAALTPALSATSIDPNLAVTAAQISLRLDANAALAHAERALAAAPGDHLVLITAAEANLAAGRPDAAAQLAERVHAEAPTNQHAIALLATAWRITNDPRYRAVYDYDALVKTWRLDTPAGWPNLDAWLADFERALNAMHELKAHPIGQSLRGGTQANQSLERSTNPAVRAFFEAIDGPIRRHMESLGQGDDVLRQRITNGYRIAGSWSVRLRPGGAHVSHVHPAGWLSSACYISLPDVVQSEGKQGWLAFGEPGIPTQPALAAEHWIKPERGMLALFPSYMWHGTAPFTGAQSRLTSAFDVIPT